MLPELGKVNREAGEFWTPNPFLMPRTGQNLSAYERNRLFLNTGGTGFLDASYFSGTDLNSDSRSVIVGDFDNDARPDLLVGSVGGGPLRLFSNRIDNPNRHRVRIELIGKTGNRTAIGARVVLDCGAAPITRDHFTANGFMGQSPAELLIGVGEAKTIRQLTVRWPDGRKQAFKNLPVDSRIVITEGEPNAKIAALAVASR